MNKERISYVIARWRYCPKCKKVMQVGHPIGLPIFKNRCIFCGNPISGNGLDPKKPKDITHKPKE